MPETEFKTYFDGDMIPHSEATVPIDDPGFQWGYNIYDLLITVNHEPYQLGEHIDRTNRSCRAANMPIDLTPDDFAAVITEVIDTNVDLITENEDFMVFISVSGGWNVYKGEPESPRVIVSVKPIPYADLATDFLDGRHLVTTSIRQLPNTTISPQIKHRSRMHFVLADIEAKRIDSNADPLLLDQDGNITETTIGNIFLISNGTLKTPPVTDVLPGVTRESTIELAQTELDIPVSIEDLQLYDAYNADEAFWTNTSHFVAPITKIDGRPVGSGRPGPVTERILEAHSERAGIDIVKRFLQHLDATAQPDILQLGGDGGVA